MPFLEIINAGKGGESSDPPSGFAGLRRFQNEEKTKMPSPESRKKAAEAFYDFLKKDNTPLRGMLALLSAGGTFYVGAVAEKTARAWMAGERVQVQNFEAAVNARVRNMSAPVAPAQDDTAGLIK